jgi:hypothetical protein
MRAQTALISVAFLVAGCAGGNDTAGGPEMRVANPSSAGTITLTSPAFANGAVIPKAHTCKGSGTPPELHWSGVPDQARSLALVVSDPDAPRGTFLHWLVYDIPPDQTAISAGVAPAGSSQGRNSGKGEGWYPPCPPRGTHHYIFTLHALDGRPTGATSQEILDWIAGHSIASGSLTGLVSA